MLFITKVLSLISEATTNLWPSISSPSIQTSIDSEARSTLEGIITSVKTMGLPKSRVTNRLAPKKKLY